MSPRLASVGWLAFGGCDGRHVDGAGPRHTAVATDSGPEPGHTGMTSGEESCGDGVVQPPEECDDGALNNDGGACTPACLAARCGDALLWVGVEGCEDDDDVNGDECTACQPPVVTSLRFSWLELRGSTYAVVGTTVWPAGDLNDDGTPDLLVGASEENDVGQSIDVLYAVFGPKLGTFDVATSADAVILGVFVTNNNPAALVAAPGGDLNGDGSDDLLVGDWKQENGSAYVVYGPIDGAVELATAAEIMGEGPNDDAGVRVAGGGDVDGDGLADVLVGAKSNDEGEVSAGATYVLYGPVIGPIGLGEADAKVMGSEDREYAGSRVALADLGGDGVDDVVIGAYGSSAGTIDGGAVYVVHGPTYGTTNVLDADHRFVGDAEDEVGLSLVNAGDLDGDGYQDLATGGPSNDYSRGIVYVLGGPWVGDMDDGDATAEILGEDAYDRAYEIGAGGDLDGDGFDDLLIGAPSQDAIDDDEGAVYVLLGPIVGNIDPLGGALKLQGEFDDDAAGTSVAIVGDFDGDGFDDGIAGAPQSSVSGQAEAGRAYLLSGGF